MKTLEDRIKAAKPEAPALPSDFAQRVMDEVALRGAAILPARGIGLRRRFCLGGALALLAAGILLSNGLAYEVRMNGTLELLFFGLRFLDSFLARLPFDLIVSVLVLSGVAAWLFHYGRFVRVAAAWVVLVSYGITGAGGLALAQSGLNERVSELAMTGERGWPLLGAFYHRRAHYRMGLAGFRMGRVVKAGSRSVRILMPNEEEVLITLPRDFVPKVGDYIRLSGMESGQGFRANRGQFCNPRSTGRYFRHMARGPGHMRRGDGMRQMGRPGEMGRRMRQMGRPGEMGRGMRQMGRGMGPMGRPGEMENRRNSTPPTMR